MNRNYLRLNHDMVLLDLCVILLLDSAKQHMQRTGQEYMKKTSNTVNTV